MSAAAALAVVSQILALRRSHGHAPALDVFDIVMKGRVGQVLDFADGVANPGEPFGQLLAEAFDECMSPTEWAAFTAPDADPKLRDGCMQIWRTYVLSRFESRYGVRIAA